MDNEIKALTEAIKNDYRQWHSNVRRNRVSRQFADRMVKDFNEGIVITKGRKYIKIVTANSVWGFIVNIDNDDKFKRGDILMPAGYNAPARNFARGNVFDEYTVHWPGAA